jgi:hypothetical protein
MQFVAVDGHYVVVICLWAGRKSPAGKYLF